MKNIKATDYKWLFCIGILMLPFTGTFSQSITKQQSFEYVDPLNKDKISKGSFRYEFIVENKNDDHDILKKPTVDFTNLKKEVRLIVSDLTLDNYKSENRTEEQKIRLYFNNAWRSYSNDELSPTNSFDKFLAVGRRPQQIRYEVEQDGNLWIKIGYRTIKDTNNPFFLNLKFTAKGTGQPAKTDEEAPVSATNATQPTPAKPTPKKEVKETKKTNKKKISSEDAAWKKAKKVDTRGAYEGFIKKYPDSKYATTATEEIEKKREEEPVKIRINQEGNVFTVILENTKNPVIIDSFTDSLGIDIRYNYENIEIELPSSKKKYTFHAKDDWGKKIPPIILDAEIAPINAGVTTSEDFLIVTVEGGIPPYSLTLYDEFGTVVKRHKLEKIAGKEIKEEIAYSELGEGLDGTYMIDLFDGRKSISQRFEDIEIHQKGMPMLPKILMVFGGIGILVLIGFLNRSNQKKKKQNLEQAKEKLQENKKTGQQPTPIVTTNAYSPKKEGTTRRTIKTKATRKVEPKIVSPVTNSERPPMKIRKRNQSTLRIGGKLSNADFIKLVNGPGQYVVINLAGTWADSAISDVYLSKDSVKEIDTFIRTTNQIAKEETEDSPPEIGGFLLGSYSFFADKNQYEISIDKFVSITPEENDVYTVAFGTQAWSKLDDIVVKSGGKSDLIGWFHTHPGHGLFLSQPDLKIHNGFFTQKYKVAIEIDTLTPDFDTAFFTRKQDGVVNNTRNRITNEWHYWTNIERITRKS